VKRLSSCTVSIRLCIIVLTLSVNETLRYYAMEISFAYERFAREVNDSKVLQRRHGDRRAKLIRRRLDELHAAATLDDLRHLPGPRCHELHGDLSGQLTVDLDHPYRLLIEPSEPVPRKADGGLDWRRVVAVVVIGVVDTHD